MIVLMIVVVHRNAIFVIVWWFKDAFFPFLSSKGIFEPPNSPKMPLDQNIGHLYLTYCFDAVWSQRFKVFIFNCQSRRFTQ